MTTEMDYTTRMRWRILRLLSGSNLTRHDLARRLSHTHGTIQVFCDRLRMERFLMAGDTFVAITPNGHAELQILESRFDPTIGATLVDDQILGTSELPVA